MSNDLFLASVTKLTSHNMPIGELISAAEGLKNAGRNDQVAQLYQIWIGLNANDPLLHVAQFNHAVVLSDAGDLAGARAALQSAIARNPDFYPAYINLGSVLERSGKSGDAITQWTALANKLSGVNGHSVNYKLTALKQIGRVLEANRLLPNAETVLKQSLDIDENQPDVVQHYLSLRLAQCEWPIVIPWEGVDKKTLLKGVGPLSMSIYTDDPLLQLAGAWSYNKFFVKYPQTDLQTPEQLAKAAARKGRLRVGYVSSDLRNHAVGFIMAELFELHDKETIEVFAYYCGIQTEDAVKDRIKNSVEHWTDITKMSDEAAAKKIMEDGIDILVDVNGYTKDARTKIFSLRPAPVIVNWLGYPGTMASPYHHYIIGDDWVIPEGSEMYYSEKVVRLPCYQPNDRKRVVSEVTPTRADAKLPDDAFVFCSFNGIQKISRFTFDRWMKILSGVPNSVLWLLDGSEAINQRLRDHAQARGVAPERIIFAEKKHNPEHLARYPLADLFLDTLPYGAHVTASDALWMGVPIITLSGRGFAARVCGDLVTAAGLPELVCDSPESFVSRAIELGKNPAEVKRLKAKLLAGRDTSLLFDTQKLITHLEALYHDMWKDFTSGNLPRPDLRNMDVYLDAGSELDHDQVETMTLPDYQGTYREHFARWHRYHPIPADSRLWTEAAIEAAEKTTAGTSTVLDMNAQLKKKKR